MEIKLWLGRVSCTVLCTVMLCASVSAYSDLPSTHWAYEEMTRAAALGLIGGVGNGRMAPDETLTWGQFMVMVARARCPVNYSNSQKAGLAWDRGAYYSLLDNNIIYPEGKEFLPINDGDFSFPITRQDAAVIIDRMLPPGYEDFETTFRWQKDAAEMFSDYEEYWPAYKLAIYRLYDAGIVQGDENGAFGGSSQLKRSDGTVLLMRAVNIMDRKQYRENMPITLRVKNTDGEDLLEPRTVETTVGTYLSDLVDGDALGYFAVKQSADRVSTVCNDYTIVYRPMTRYERAVYDYEKAIENGEASYEEYWMQDFQLLDPYGGNPRKHMELYGNTEQTRFESREDAEAHMKTVTVPVWRISKGKKVEGKTSFIIHEAIAEDVIAIFTEIFYDPEQFPIRDLGGYSWRGDESRSEHNCGTAIDINSNENYQVRDGQALAGSHYKPYDDPYSIPEDSSVVCIFREHGWYWGGKGWGQPGYYDYMHFSYLGG